MAETIFEGFPEDALRFLHELSQNNEKSWFDANKVRYQETVIAVAPAFVAALGERLKEGISPGIVYDTRTNGAGSMMRIYRDTRFSKDKTPYKTNVAFVFWEGPRKKMENPSFGLQFGTWGCGIYAGLWGFQKDTLERFREAVVDDKKGSEWEAIIAQVEGAGDYSVEGDQYQRVPSGYDADHPRAELLKYKGLHASSPQMDIQLVTTPDFVDVCYAHCKAMAPLQQWLVKVDQGG